MPKKPRSRHRSAPLSPARVVGSAYHPTGRKTPPAKVPALISGVQAPEPSPSIKKPTKAQQANRAKAPKPADNTKAPKGAKKAASLLPEVPTPRTRTRPAQQPEWPEPKVAALRIERMAIEDLKPHPRNPRIHPEPGSPKWEVLKASLRHDYFDPLVWNTRNGKLVSGHLRRKVFAELGVTHADVVVVDYDEPTHIARLMAANKAIGEDDFELAKELFKELKGIEGFELELTGFDRDEIVALYPDDLEEDDKGPPISEEDLHRLEHLVSHIKKPRIVPVLGDLWAMGRHRLYVGSLVRDAALWTGPLVEALDKEGDYPVLFVPCPDPYVSLTGKDITLFLIQPELFVAGHILSNYSDAFPEESCFKLSGREV